ncbi:MAG: hypothetical protein ABIO46_14440 [Chitinophagales bacterium]
MATIQINISDEALDILGKKKIEELAEREAADLQFAELQKKLIRKLKNTKGVDWEKEFESARQKAYQEWIVQWKSNGKKLRH